MKQRCLYICLLLICTKLVPNDGLSVHYAYKVYNIQRPGEIDSDSEILKLCGSGENKWYLIKNAVSDLVAEATDSNEFKVQSFSGKPEQLWKFEPADKPGLYYIVNKKSGKVMQSRQDNHLLNMNEKNGFLNQKWVLNHDGRIVNAGTKHILDVAGGKFVPGNPLIALGVFNGNQANEFVLQEHLKQGDNSETTEVVTAN